MKCIITILLLSILMACSSNTDKQVFDSTPIEEKDIEENIIITDTLSAISPLYIGNDKGSVTVVGIRTFKNNEIINSNFTITLMDVE